MITGGEDLMYFQLYNTIIKELNSGTSENLHYLSKF